MATQYKLIVKENVTAATSTIALTAAAANTVVASVTGTDAGGSANVEVLVKKAAGGLVELAYQAITTTTPTELLVAPVALEASDVLYVRTSRTGTNFIVSYVEDTEAVAGQAISVLSDVDTTGVLDGDALIYDSVSGNWEAGTASSVAAMNDLTDVSSTSPITGDVLTYSAGAWREDGYLQTLKTVVGKGVSTSGVYNTIDDTTKGYAEYAADGFTAGKNNTKFTLSENSPGIMDFIVQDDDAVTPTSVTAMRVTNETGGTQAPQVIVGGTTASGSNTLTVTGTSNFSGNVTAAADLTVTGTLNASISTQQISDFSISSPSTNQVLKYQGGNWVNTADSAGFSTLAVSGQSNIVADDYKDTLNIAAGTGITLTTDAGTDTLTIAQDTPYSYLYTNGAASATWSVSHNLDTTSPVVQCYDDAGDQIIPQNIAITDANNLVITWGASQDGRAIIGGGTWASNPIPNVVFVGSAGDFPTPSAGVITLAANVTYFITDDIDLGGDRLVGSANTTIIGGSSENCKITSTGLGVGVALFTTAWTTPIRHVTFYGVDTAIDIEGVTNAPVALDWTGMNFKDVPNIGTIDTCDNFIYSKGAILNSKGLVFDGTVGTVGIDNSIAVGSGAAGSIMELAPTATITRRFRIIYSSIVAFGSTTGIDIDSLATVPTESFILDTVNFSGGSTYLPDVDHTSNEARFENCKGVTNTSVNGQMYMQGNATATTITAANTFYKVAGVTSASSDNAKFTETDNRLTCDATLPRKFMLTAHLSFTAGNNQDIEFGFYDSTLSAVRTPSRTVTTTDGGGSAQNVGFSCVTTMEDLDYIEIHCANNTSTTNVTVTNMNVLITEV